jgi:D-tagatose-1,6-bisphosphate aldolase subunit GatZ/KbaZ
MNSPLAHIVHQHKLGHRVGVYSICSAHPLVIEAAMRQALEDGGIVLIEATSNQVDQFGGYTGMQPADFRDFCHRIADSLGFPHSHLVLGGDHLGPNRWQGLDAETAMAHADDLVSAYVRAGYEKIHLDCSMSCANDPVPLDDHEVAARATRLLAVAEREAAQLTGGTDRIRYVIGTEVPVPGGAHEEIAELTPTTPEAARATIRAHREAFAAAGLGHVWPRVMALVVQPGVEFDHLKVVDYKPERTTSLSRVLDDEPTLLFEAHSTDYQQPEAFVRLVEEHWAVLKVGPGLTFALREAVFALACIEREMLPEDRTSRIESVIEEQMLANPVHWRNYYAGTADEQRFARRFSYSDRMRYYWPDPVVEKALTTLLENLSTAPIPLPLISQYLPLQYDRVREGSLAATPRELIIDHVRDAMRPYAVACGAGPTPL